MSSSRNEARSLTLGAFALLTVSLLRYGSVLVDRYTASPPTEVAVALDSLGARTREVIAESERRSRPIDAGETIDPNQAGSVELDRLPGVGPSTAEAIVAARDSGLVFRRAEDLLVVRGIGPATLVRIGPHLDFAMARRRSSAARVERRPRPPRAEGLRSNVAIDVNTADLALLETLPGVGPALAGRIITERVKRPFTDVDDLLRVRGVGPVTVGRLRGLAVAHQRR